MQTGLPKDTVMMLSVVNTKLRDHYKSLDELCLDMEIEKKVITDKLSAIDYIYNEQRNQFE